MRRRIGCCMLICHLEAVHGQGNQRLARSPNQLNTVTRRPTRQIAATVAV
jgi:hypothetical protein